MSRQDLNNPPTSVGDILVGIMWIIVACWLVAAVLFGIDAGWNNAYDGGTDDRAEPVCVLFRHGDHAIEAANG